MTISDIVTKVRVILNEAGEEESLHLLSEDTVKLTQYIESVIPDAINLVITVSPISHINTTKGSNTLINGDGCSVISLPTDFLRIAAIKLSNWKRSVSVVMPFGGDEYKKQHNVITRSGVNKPSCVFAYNTSGSIIECFPSGSLEYFHYVKSASSESNKGLGLVKEELLPAICYMCASLVYNIFENPNTSERMKAIAIELIPKE